MSLIELMLVLAIGGVVAAVSTNLVLQVIQNQKRNNFIAQILLLRESFMNVLQDNRAWDATVNDPRNSVALACLRNVTACPAATVEFTPITSEGQPFMGYSRLAAGGAVNNGVGFTAQGELCNAASGLFNQANPAVNCPVQLRFTAQFLTATVNPQVRIRMRFLFAMNQRTGLGPSLNPANYDPAPFDRAGTQTFVVPMNCPTPATQVVAGFNADGSVICEPRTRYRVPPPPPAKSSPAPKASPKAKSR